MNPENQQKPQVFTHMTTLQEDKTITDNMNIDVTPISRATLAIKRAIKTRIVKLWLVTARIKITMQTNINNQGVVHDLQAGTMTFKIT